MALNAALAIAAVSGAQAGEDDWRLGWDGTFYGYANSTGVNSDSVLNPGNRLAQLPTSGESLELRANFKAESEALRFTGRAIGRACELHSDYPTEQCSEAYFSQWQARLRLVED